jgi:hypothetical protein
MASSIASSDARARGGRRVMKLPLVELLMASAGG